MNSPTDRIRRVYDAINGQAGAPFAKGELVIERAFARAFLEWVAVEKAPSPATPEDSLLACCRHLNLDLICLHADEVRKHCPGPADIGRYIGRFVQQRLFVFWVVSGPYQTASRRMGFDDFYLNCADHPEAVFAKMSEISGDILREAAFGVKSGAHGIMIAEDIAHARGLLVSPRFVKTFLMPLWMEQVKTARHLKVPVFFHSDGNIDSLLPLITAAGFDGLQCIEPGASMPIGKVKSTYGKKRCLMGNLDPSLLIDRPEPENEKGDYRRLSETVRSLISEASPGGRFIFGTCSGLYEGLSPERVFFMHRLADEFNSGRSAQVARDEILI